MDLHISWIPLNVDAEVDWIHAFLSHFVTPVDHWIRLGMFMAFK
ncbi:MAG TPA: hypothetical protein VK618_00100 [Flavitalea sp.]|nr:hypothetical protein [Flavitalea sp.]